jgi:hypothetical protein
MAKSRMYLSHPMLRCLYEVCEGIAGLEPLSYQCLCIASQRCMFEDIRLDRSDSFYGIVFDQLELLV